MSLLGTKTPSFRNLLPLYNDTARTKNLRVSCKVVWINGIVIPIPASCVEASLTTMVDDSGPEVRVARRTHLSCRVARTYISGAGARSSMENLTPWSEIVTGCRLSQERGAPGPALNFLNVRAS